MKCARTTLDKKKIKIKPFGFTLINIKAYLGHLIRRVMEVEGRRAVGRPEKTCSGRGHEKVEHRRIYGRG